MRGNKLGLALGASAAVLWCGCAGGYVEAGGVVGDAGVYGPAPVYVEPYYDPFYYGPDVYIYDGHRYPHHHYAQDYSHRGVESRGHFHHFNRPEQGNFGHVGRAPGGVRGSDHGFDRRRH